MNRNANAMQNLQQCDCYALSYHVIGKMPSLFTGMLSMRDLAQEASPTVTYFRCNIPTLKGFHLLHYYCKTMHNLDVHMLDLNITILYC